MKKIVLTTIALMAFVAIPSFAQNESPAGKPGKLEMRSVQTEEISARHNKRSAKCVYEKEAKDTDVELQQFCPTTLSEGKCDKRDCRKEKADCRKGDRKRFNPMEGLALTDSQKAEVRKAREKRAEKNLKLKKKICKEREKISESYMKEMKKILTPEQFAKFKENVEKSNKFDKAGKHRHHGKKDCKRSKKGKHHKEGRHGRKDCDKQCDRK